MRSGEVVLLHQADATARWKALLDSTVAASSWDIFPGLEIVLVLLDDAEFGQDIKWFFSPAVKTWADFKLLLVFVETCMELLLTFAGAPGLVQQLRDLPRTDVPFVDRNPDKIRSASFCLAFESGSLIPKDMEQKIEFVGRVKATTLFDRMFIDDPIFKKPVFCWQILDALRACVSRDVACMGGTLHVRFNKAVLALDPALAKLVLSVVKIQLEMIADFIGKVINRP